jgi:16S rRNA pseudouridine516 synthase
MGGTHRQRLDAFLAHAGLGTRSEVRKLIRSGKVALDGGRCRSAAEQVAGRVVSVEGEVVTLLPEATHFALHKPRGYACSHDGAEAPIVDALLPDILLHAGIQSAGRLDRETSGLLILSTDGALIHALTHPNRKVARRYRIEFEGVLPDDAIARCREGLVLRAESTSTKPAELVVDGPGRATLSLREGRYHQVRRMFAALGTHVTGLHRDRIGAYVLPADLPPGALRLLERADLALLRSEMSL